MKRIVSLFACGALLLAPAAFAQSAPADTSLPAQELVLKVIQVTPEVQAARAMLDRAEAEARMRQAGPHEPQLSLIPQTRRIDGDRRYREWEVDLSRGVRWPGKARLDREIGAAGREAASLAFEDAHHAAARRLLALWSDWQRAAAIAGLREAQLAAWQRERAAVMRRVQLGDAAARDRIALDAAVAQAEAAVAQAQAEADTTRLALSSAFPDLPLPGQVHLPATVTALDGSDATWIDLIQQRSHEIGTAAAIARKKDAEARRARADRLPDPQIGLRVISDRGGREHAYGVTVTLPLGVSYRAAEAAAAGADAMGAQADLAMVRRDVGRDARQVVTLARARYTIWQRQQQAAEATASSADKAERGYALGELGLDEMLIARRAAQESELAASRAEIDAIEAVTRVKVDAHAMWHRHDPGDHDEEMPVAVATEAADPMRPALPALPAGQ
ncbi:MAG: TolC family protein [Xanthomonadaceae bacterium]|nr:TolC family protein [Xanthomonadaceae bacterium]MDE1964790.1 TolC family protein [Xanthomonadaceae bacterium]